MTNFDRALASATALTRQLEGRGTTYDEISDALLAEAIGICNVIRGRVETAGRLRFIVEYLEAANGGD
jgi:hypothetical protein